MLEYRGEQITKFDRVIDLQSKWYEMQKAVFEFAVSVQEEAAKAAVAVPAPDDD